MSQVGPASSLGEGAEHRNLPLLTTGGRRWSNLKLLAGRTHSWVESEFDRICDKITAELETKSNEELQGLGKATVRVPSKSEVAGTRDAP